MNCNIFSNIFFGKTKVAFFAYFSKKKVFLTLIVFNLPACLHQIALVHFSILQNCFSTKDGGLDLSNIG